MNQSSQPAFKPVHLAELDLCEPLQPASLSSLADKHGAIQWLIRLNRVPVGQIQLTLPHDDLTPEQLSSEIMSQAGEGIRAQLARLNQPVPTSLVMGIDCTTMRDYLAIDADNAPFITVALCTHERPDGAAATVDSLLKLAYPNYEILIVDNAPQTDKTEKLVAERYGDNPQVRYVQEPDKGLSHARNCALKEAAGEIISFTDDDVLVDPWWLNGVANRFLQDDKLVCVNGLTIPAELNTQAQMLFEEHSGFNKGFHPIAYDMQENRPDRAFYPFSAGLFGTGANMSIRKTVIVDEGGYDTALGAGTPSRGGEDIAMYVHLLLKGYRIAYDPAALVYHIHRRDYEALEKQIYGYGTGFTAFLTQVLLSHPMQIPGFLLKIPYGLYLALSPSSFKNDKKQDDYPEELSRLELRGMIQGPWLYLKRRLSG